MRHHGHNAKDKSLEHWQKLIIGSVSYHGLYQVLTKWTNCNRGLNRSMNHRGVSFQVLLNTFLIILMQTVTFLLLILCLLCAGSNLIWHQNLHQTHSLIISNKFSHLIMLSPGVDQLLGVYQHLKVATKWWLTLLWFISSFLCTFQFFLLFDGKGPENAKKILFQPSNRMTITHFLVKMHSSHHPL